MASFTGSTAATSAAAGADVTDDDTARPLDEVLDVYASRDGGWWNPEHGDVAIPDGWDLLPSGDAYVSRTVEQP